MSGTEVQNTLREMWETRPTRPREGRQIAGVAAGIARRYDIDPILVRVGFVVAAFYGIGAALYIAGWVVLPEEPGDRGAPRSTPRPLLVIGFAVACALSVSAIFGGGRVLLPALIAACLLALLHRSRGRHGATPSAGAPGGEPAAADAPTTPTSAADAGAPNTPEQDTAAQPAAEPLVDRPVPPAWDPLGAAPFAWDLPEPAPAPQPPAERPRRPLTTVVTLAAALLAGGLTGLVMLLTGGGLSGLPVLLGVVLAVLGTGLLVGAFTRSGRGLIPFALLLAVLTYAVLAAPLDRWQGPAGDLRFAPVTAAAVAPVYQQSVGSFLLDLRQLDLAVPAGAPQTGAGPIRTSVRLGMGEAKVILPRDADVTMRGETGVGRVAFLGSTTPGGGATDRESVGTHPRLTVVDDLGADGVRSGRAIELDIATGMGNVEVLRG